MKLKFVIMLFVVLNIKSFSYNINQNLNTESHEIFNAKRNFLQKGVRLSLVQLDSVLRIDTNNLTALENLGIAYFELNILDESLKFFKKAEAITDTSFRTMLYIARIYTLKNKFKQALKYYYLCYSINSNDLESLEFIAEMSIKNSDYEKAELFYKKIFDKQPENKNAITNLGVIFDKKNNKSLALEKFEKCVELYPKSISCLLNLSYMELKLKKFHEAFLNVNKALSISPDHARANMFMGVLLFNKRVYSEAMPYFKIYLKYEPEDHDVRIGLALCNYYTNNTNDALDELSKIINKVVDDKYEILLLMADICLSDEKFDRAIKYIKRAINEDNKKPLAHEILSKVYDSKGLDSLAKSEEDGLANEKSSTYKVGSVIKYFSKQ